MNQDERQQHNRVVQAAVTRLKEIATEYAHDPEEAHSQADVLLCALLVQLGYSAVVNQFVSMKKWYA